MVSEVKSTKSTYHFTQQEDVLTPHEEDPARDIGVEISSIYALNSILENKVRYEAAREAGKTKFLRTMMRWSYRTGPSFARHRPISSRHAKQALASLGDKKKAMLAAGFSQFFNSSRIHVLSVRSSNCAAVVNICGGS